MHESGDLSAWNKGLTREIDDRVAQYAESNKESWTKEKRRKYSKIMKENRLSGIIPTLSKEDHSQWKGGTSSVSARCHGSRRLYQEWKYPKLKESGFECMRCGSKERLEVHHDKEKMADIIHMITKRLNPDKKNDFELQTNVVHAVVDYHIEKNISGEVICNYCHKEEHPSYNYKT